MTALLRHLFFALIVRPLVLVVIGLNVRHRERLPTSGPAIIVANHNSHLDTLVLMTLFPPRLLRHLRPVAAADYFLRNRLLAWFATRIIGIVPISRGRDAGNPLHGCFEALKAGDILILFPEGSRGEPEHRSGAFKQGVRVIARKYPEVPVTPVFLHGLGKALPKGEAVLVPFFCDVFIGPPLTYHQTEEAFLERLGTAVEELAAEGQFPAWE
jgi:1-acyl-sn-glycerol-3-phosphate acyltransferase